MLIIDDDVWIGNTGDSRAILSSNGGQKFTSISNDHKPSEEPERKRILKAGGQVYQNNNIMLAGPGGPVTQGPVRVIPGRLSVSRTFGDCPHQFLTTTNLPKNQRGREFSKLVDRFTKTITLCLQAQEDR